MVCILFYNLFMVKIICKFYIIINIFNKIIKIKFMLYRFDINMFFIFLFFSKNNFILFIVFIF